MRWRFIARLRKQRGPATSRKCNFPAAAGTSSSGRVTSGGAQAYIFSYYEKLLAAAGIFLRARAKIRAGDNEW